MYCGKCNEYIPSGLGITHCPNCGVSLAEAEQLARRKAEEAGKAREAAEIQKKKEIRAGRPRNLVQALYLCFFSPRIYRDAAHHWRGAGIFFLLLLTGLVFIPYSVSRQAKFSQAWNRHTKTIIDQLPAIEISGGTARIDAKSPHVIRNPDTQQIYAILDTSGMYTNLQNLPAWVLLTGKQLSIRQSSNDIRTVYLGPDTNLRFNRDMVSSWAALAGKWLSLWVYPFFWGIGWFAALFGALCFSLIAFVINLILRARLSYGALFRITAVAIAPGIYIDGIAMAAAPLPPLLDHALWLLPVAYLIFGIRHAKKAEPASEPPAGTGKPPLFKAG